MLNFVYFISICKIFIKSLSIIFIFISNNILQIFQKNFKIFKKNNNAVLYWLFLRSNNWHLIVYNVYNFKNIY